MMLRTPGGRLAGGVVLAVSMAAVLAACGKSQGADGPPGHGGPPPQVETVVVQAQALPVTFEYTGQTAGSREVEVLEVDLPAVLTAQKGLAEPRLPGLKGIMAAKKKPLVEKSPAAAPSPTEVRSMSLPPGRKACVKVPATREGVQQLLAALRSERGVL